MKTSTRTNGLRALVQNAIPASKTALVVLLSISLPLAQAQTPQINASNWGTVTSPVFGTSEKGVYSSAELFAGPNKFGSYFSGVLPNGRIVKPAGVTAQVGGNPLGVALTPDGKYLISSNDDEREGGLPSYQNATNIGGYSLSVVDTSSMNVISQINTAGKFYIGLQVTGAGPYTVFASGGADNDVKLFNISINGVISQSTPANIVIKPITPINAGYVSNYVPDAVMNTADSNGIKPSVPTNFNAATGNQTTFPAGSAVSPDGKYLYVACNGDNSVAVIDTAALRVVRQVPVGYFPYGVSVNAAGNRVFVANWGVQEYKFYNPTYDPSTGKLTSLGATAPNYPDGFYVSNTDATGHNPKTSSVSMLNAPGGNGAALTLMGATYQGKPLDMLNQVGDTHPSATAIVKQKGGLEVLYVTKTNSDSLGAMRLDTNQKLADVDLSPIALTLKDGHPVHGSYPNAIVVSPDNTRMYVAEAGLNSVAVLDVTDVLNPRLLGRIGTGWYPTALTISSDGNTLFIANAKGIAGDVNNAIDTAASHNPSGVTSDSNTDSNYIFGTVQKVPVGAVTYDNTTVIGQNYKVNAGNVDASIVPVGGTASAKIKHVFMILHENKTFDSELGNQAGHFGPFSSTTFNDTKGLPYTNLQYTGVSLNVQTLANKFATAVNYFSDSEESDAGHQFAASGTSSDYTQKTLLVKSGRGNLVEKNFETEDYPEGGYIFNNAVRNGVSFKDYGAMIRITGTDEGTSKPTTLSDPTSGSAGYPALNGINLSNPLVVNGDTTSPTQGLGQSYFLALPVLAVLGTNNPNGEPRLDANYPGYNFNISDQRRAKEFIADFDRMVANNTLPQFIYLYQPNDHTGGVQAPNAAAVGTSPVQQVADGDIGFGMVVNHIMNSPVYYDAASDTGSAIFMTWDDAQSTRDHIHPHRTPLLVISPYAKPGFVATRHYSTASVVKTEELLLGLPPNNLGDLFATDLRDMFQSFYNGIQATDVPVTMTAANYQPSPEGKKIWAMVKQLDTTKGPDQDSIRLGTLAQLSMDADALHVKATKERKLKSRQYKAEQAKLLKQATVVVNGPKRDADD